MVATELHFQKMQACTCFTFHDAIITKLCSTRFTGMCMEATISVLKHPCSLFHSFKKNGSWRKWHHHARNTSNRPIYARSCMHVRHTCVHSVRCGYHIVLVYGVFNVFIIYLNIFECIINMLQCI
jgi:hypothetical protein